MPDKPAADMRIDEALVRALVVSHAASVVPEAATLPLRHAADGPAA